MVKNVSFKFCQLTFIKTDVEELNQLENTILMQSVFHEYNQLLPLKKALSKTQYGFSASAQNSGNCRLLRITDIKENGIDWSTVPFCDCQEIEKYKLNEKDILITRTGGTTGKTTLINEIKETSIFASYLIRLSVSEDYNPEYIYLFLNSYLFWNQILDLKNGTAQPNVNANKMTTILFPSCPKDVQDEIVEYKKYNISKSSIVSKSQLDFQKINVSYQNLKLILTENEKQQLYITQLKQAILQEAISGKLTAEWRKQNPMQKGNPDTDAVALLDKIKAEKQQLINDGKLKKEKPLPPISNDEVPFSLPDGWVWCRFGEFATFERGRFSIRPRNDQSCFGGLYPFIQINSLSKNGDVITEYKQTLNEKGRSVSKEFPKGTLVIAIVGGTIGNLGVLGIDMCFTDSMVGVKPSGIRNQNFTLLLLRYKQPEIQNAAYQMAGQPNIKIPTFTNLIIPLPPLAEQKAIVEKVDYLMKQIEELEAQIKHRKQLAEELMQTVLREAFV